MKFRPQRGSLHEAMKEVVDLPDRAALLEHLRRTYESISGWPGAPDIREETVHVEPYHGIDTRIGWDTYIVMIDGWGPAGFTDGPCPPQMDSHAKEAIVPDAVTKFMEAFEDAYYDLPEHERPVFMLLMLRAWREKLQASIKDRPTGAEKESALQLIQKVEEMITELERTVPQSQQGES